MASHVTSTRGIEYSAIHSRAALSRSRSDATGIGNCDHGFFIREPQKALVIRFMPDRCSHRAYLHRTDHRSVPASLIQAEDIERIEETSMNSNRNFSLLEPSVIRLLVLIVTAQRFAVRSEQCRGRLQYDCGLFLVLAYR